MALQFGITRQAAHKHLSDLVDEGILAASGATRGREYRLAVIDQANLKLKIERGLAEDEVWTTYIRPKMTGVPDNVTSICHYGFTEILNNVVDHSQGSLASIKFSRTAGSLEFWITDNGIGIFNKIQRALGLPDPRLAILELAKGKLTTDPANHTGEGIFFSSRMFDRFTILSGNLFFDHSIPDDDWLIESQKSTTRGTVVVMIASLWTRLTAKEVFDKYSDEENYSFSKTHVPVRLAQFGEDQLVSRSQAKRVLARIDRFAEVILDFHGVESIGQAFADEVFRVFATRNPKVKIVAINENPDVKKMIQRAQASSLEAKQQTGSDTFNGKK